MSILIKVNKLTARYDNIEAIRDIDLEINEGEYLGIIGPNGGGKSTLLKTILGLVKPVSGTVNIANKDSIGYVPQFAVMDKKFPITVFEAVLEGKLNKKLIPFFRYTKEDKDDVYNMLEKVGLKDFAKRQISELSGGEFQKMLIARALVLKPKLLLLDEPTASVDSASREHIFSLLAQLNKEGMTVILVTHDLLAVSSEVKSLACMNRTLVYHGQPELNEHVVNSLYGCPVDLIAHGVPHRVLKDHEGDCDHC